jgi:hypothetical protein
VLALAILGAATLWVLRARDPVTLLAGRAVVMPFHHRIGADADRAALPAIR